MTFKWPDFGEQETVVCDTWALYRIVALAGPIMVNGRCAECGAAWSDASPPTVSHNAFCRGMERAREVSMAITEAVETAQKPSWWRRLLFWV